MVRVLQPGLPLDYRVLLAGYVPDYVYDFGAMDTISMPFAALRQLPDRTWAARQASTDPEFSRKIRDGVPVPQYKHLA